MVPSQLNRRHTLLGLVAAGLGAPSLVSGERAGVPARPSTAPASQQAGSARGSCDHVVPDDFATIQAALDGAADGDVICVKPGTYAESLAVVTADITLRATSSRAATIDASGHGTGVLIEASGFTIEGLEISGDDGTTSGVSIDTSAGATAGITLRDNHVHGMSKPGGGGAFSVSSWGVLSYGDSPLTDVLLEDNTIEDIGGDGSSSASSDSGVAGILDSVTPSLVSPAGMGIGLEEVEGDRPRAGAVIRRNTVRDVHDGAVGLDGNSLPLPGVGIAVQPLDGQSSGAGHPATDVHRNTIETTHVDVLLGEVGLTTVRDNE